MSNSKEPAESQLEDFKKHVKVIIVWLYFSGFLILK